MQHEIENVNEEETSKGMQEPQNGNDNETENHLQSEEEALREYAKLQDGDTVVWQFSQDPKKRRLGPWTPKGKDKPIDTMWFKITTREDPDYELEWRVTSKQLMRALVNRYITQGKTLLELSRTGSRQDNTVYRIRALHDDKVLVITNKETHWEQAPLQQKQLSSSSQAA